MEHNQLPKEDAPLLERLHSPKDLKGLSLEQCESLCEEIRSLLVETVSKPAGISPPTSVLWN